MRAQASATVRAVSETVAPLFLSSHAATEPKQIVAGLSGCRQKYEDGDEHEEWIADQPEHAEQDRQALAEACRHVRGTRISEPRREQSAQHPAAIHGKCRYHIEEDQEHVDHKQTLGEVTSCRAEIG